MKTTVASKREGSGAAGGAVTVTGTVTVRRTPSGTGASGGSEPEPGLVLTFTSASRRGASSSTFILRFVFSGC